jgi:Lamin Tail Domain
MKLVSILATAGLLSFATASQAQLLITGIMDGTLDNGQPTFVEIRNVSGSSLNLSGYSLNIYSDGATSATDSLDLSLVMGSLPAGEFIVIHGSQATFDLVWPTVPSNVTEYYWSPCIMDGNDPITIETEAAKSDAKVPPTPTPTLIVIDVYGSIGTKLTTWEYTDTYATRTSGPSSSTWIAAQWNVQPISTLNGTDASAHGAALPLGSNASLPVGLDFFAVE